MFRPLFNKGFLKLGQKYKNIFVGFLVQMKTLKFAFEINWPLAPYLAGSIIVLRKLFVRLAHRAYGARLEQWEWWAATSTVAWRRACLYHCHVTSISPNVSRYNPIIRQWGFRQCLPFSWTTLRGKHCRHPIAVMGVVDTFGPCVTTYLPKFLSKQL